VIETRHHRSAARIIVAKTSFIAALSSGKPADHLGPAAFLNNVAFGQVGGAHPDPMPDRHPVDRQQGVEVVGEHATAAGKLRS
jgi:hypothetical protein